jgi:hypothetical protein
MMNGMNMMRPNMNPNGGQSPFSQQNAMQKLMGQMTGNLQPQLPSLPIQNMQGMMGASAKAAPGWGSSNAQKFSVGNKLALLKSYAGVSSLKSGFDPRTLYRY